MRAHAATVGCGLMRFVINTNLQKVEVYTKVSSCVEKETPVVVISTRGILPLLVEANRPSRPYETN